MLHCKVKDPQIMYTSLLKLQYEAAISAKHHDLKKDCCTLQLFYDTLADNFTSFTYDNSGSAVAMGLPQKYRCLEKNDFGMTYLLNFFTM